TRFVLLIVLLLFSGALAAQIRVSKLVIGKNEAYELKNSDILVADTLVMMDSARLVLNKLKRDNYIRAQTVIVGNHCIIDGRGLNGEPGKSGAPGTTPYGPCSDGTRGRNGGRGLDGTPGVNLFLYIEDIKLSGTLTIDLSGGNGGRGG